MQVHVNTDRNIQGHAALVNGVESSVLERLERFSPQVTRVEVHLTDENGGKTVGDDKRCVMEARLSGLKPYVVTHDAGSIDQAVDGALDRLNSVLDSALGKLSQKKGSPSFGHLPPS